MKKNRKGFTLIETLLVSTFVIGTLVYLFVQFSNIKKTYDINFVRDTIPSLYYVQNINSYLESTDISNIIATLNTKDYVEIESCGFTINSASYCRQLMNMANVKKAIVVTTDLKGFQERLQQSNQPFSETMYQYILSLSPPKIEINRLIVEFNNGTVASLQFN